MKNDYNLEVKLSDFMTIAYTRQHAKCHMATIEKPVEKAKKLVFGVAKAK